MLRRFLGGRERPCQAKVRSLHGVFAMVIEAALRKNK
jgi:hypothetical protein